MLSGQYRFHETLDAYRAAQKIRADDAMLYIRMSGAALTLRHFEEAKKAYDRSCSVSGNEKAVAYTMGAWNYLQK